VSQVSRSPYEGRFRRKLLTITEWTHVFSTDVPGLLLLVHHDGTLEGDELLNPPPFTGYQRVPWEHASLELKEMVFAGFEPDVRETLLALEGLE